MENQYRMVNGLFCQNGEPRIGLGVSYYASYHPAKVPVPEGDRRQPEMKKDLQDIKDAGFDLVRCAALGEVGRTDDGAIDARFPFVDAMLEQAETLDLAFQVRLQGYTMTFGDDGDTVMVDAEGREMPFHWGWFVRSCLHHPQVLQDNLDGTQASAEHFCTFSAVTSYQLYNEPAYPSRGLYCYNPYTVEAYRQWLQAKYRSIEALNKAWQGWHHALGCYRQWDEIQPPRERPAASGHAQAWVDWRVFSTDALSRFIGAVGSSSRSGDPERPVFTNPMPCPFQADAAVRGEDFYGMAEETDFLGLTLYGLSNPTRTEWACMVLDGAESAAAGRGKTAWLIEYDAHVDLSPADYERQTYAALARGIKGIMYYQWRADCPVEGAPEPQMFGMVDADRRPTEKLDTAKAMNHCIHRVSPALAAADKVRSGAAILYSKHAAAHHDAVGTIGSLLQTMQTIYTAFRTRQVPLDFVEAKDLDENLVGIQTVLVPSSAGLRAEEVDMLRQFAGQGDGNVITLDSGDTWTIEGFKACAPNAHAVAGLLHDLIADGWVFQPVQIEGSEQSEDLDVRCLRSSEKLVIVISNFGREKHDVSLILDPHLAGDVPWSSGTVYQPAGRCSIIPEHRADSPVVTIPDVQTGAFLVLE